MANPPARIRQSMAWVALATLVAIGGCGGENAVADSPGASSPVASVQAPSTTVTTIATSSTVAEPADDPAEGTWVATAIVDNINTFASPNAEAAVWAFPSPTQFGGERVFLVVGEEAEFLHVQLPVRPNGTTGWIRRDDVVLSEVTTRATIDLRTNSLTVWDGDDVIVETSAAVGKPATPTPLGTFYVRDIIEKWPESAYGSYILGLSGYSEVLETFAGGEPAIAIHGTNRPDLIGEEVSNGCVRIPNDLVELLAKSVPLGTPVEIIG